MNCWPKTLAMSLGSTCVLFLKAMEPLSCRGGRLWASPCTVYQQVPVPLPWSHGLSMCSFQISVLFVPMRVEISLFSSGTLGSRGVSLPAKSLRDTLPRMGCGRSLSASRILPTGTCFLPAWQSMLVNIPPASCTHVGGCSAAKATPVSVQICPSPPSCSWHTTVCSVALCLPSVYIVSSIGRWSEFSARTVLQDVLPQSEDDMAVMPGNAGRWCALPDTPAGLSVLSVMWPESESVSETSPPRWPSVHECQNVRSHHL